MKFENYADRFIDFIDNLSDDEFENFLLEFGIQRYFSAFSKKKNTLVFEDAAPKVNANNGKQKIKIDNLKGDSGFQFNYKLKSGSKTGISSNREAA